MTTHPTKPASRYAAVAGTLALHAALIAVVATGLSDTLARNAASVPIQVALLPTAPAAAPSAPSVPPAPPAPAAMPPQAEPEPVMPRPTTAKPEPEAVKAKRKPVATKRRPPKPKPLPQPATPVRQQPLPPAAPAPAPAMAPPSRSAATAAAAPAERPSAPPVKTGVSISASYAASNRKPPYPRLSQINDEQGTVLLRVLVRADGSAGSVQIKASSGYALLDEAAKSTVETWRFKPATIDGKPLSEWYQLAIPFTLQDD